MVVSSVAMHMSDGIVNAPASLGFGLVAIVAMGLCAWRARTELDERTVPLAGLVAAFIFAVQMVNFPILPGVSGHLLGGALAAILVGPYTGALCIGIVLIVQSLLFADGGVTALGANITNMAVIGVAVGYATALLLYAIARRRTAGVAVPVLGTIAFVAAVVGTVCAAMGFVVEYAIGGAATTSLSTVAGYMFGTHVLIGIGEGVITAVTVMAVARSRPDLVYLLRTSRNRSEVTV
jgi:cobalt/nickel transport system permease protein